MTYTYVYLYSAFIQVIGKLDVKKQESKEKMKLKLPKCNLFQNVEHICIYASTCFNMF